MLILLIMEIILTCKLNDFPISLTIYTFSIITANDIDQNWTGVKKTRDSWTGESSRKETKPYDSCGSFFTILLLCDLYLSTFSRRLGQSYLSVLFFRFLIQALMKMRGKLNRHHTNANQWLIFSDWGHQGCNCRNSEY